MNQRGQLFKYILADLSSAAISWFLFYAFRKTIIEGAILEPDQNFYLGLIFIPLYWVLLYRIFGLYGDVFRRNRLKELSQTLSTSILGVLFLFFTLLLDDEIGNYRHYYHSLLTLFSLHFGLTFFFRFLLTTNLVKKVHKGKITFNTLFIGGNQNALNTLEEIRGSRQSAGHHFVGYLNINGSDHQLKQALPLLGSFENLSVAIENHRVEEVIIAAESSDHGLARKIITELENQKVYINIIPDMYDILSGSVKMSSIFGTPLIKINPEIMPQWQYSLKRFMDITLSTIAIILLSPVYLTLAILVKMSSKGPVIFRQQRIGKHGEPFTIFKFRSMFLDAEKDGPQLSSTSDNRITPIGKFLRKTRLDEIPQFFNVLKGDMALVGPRPERQFFIDQIMKEAPHYKHLQRVRPGITSWGQVKYGYAENVEQMIQRLKYDVLYIENMTIALDLKILIYTVLIVFKGSGK